MLVGVALLLLARPARGTFDPYRALQLGREDDEDGPLPPRLDPDLGGDAAAPLPRTSSVATATSARPMVGAAEPDLVVHLVPHSRVKHAWLETVDEVEPRVGEVLASVMAALDADPSRKFAWGEVHYFRKWFEGLPARHADRIRRLVRDGNLEFVGGLVPHDEATCSSMHAVTDSLLEARNWLEAMFGISPKVAWQLDSYGHSDASPALFARAGYSVLVIDKIHFRIRQRFRSLQHLEFVWRGRKPWAVDAVRKSSATASTPSPSSSSLPASDEIFTHVLPFGYAAPDGFDFERSGVRQITAPRGRATRLVAYARELARMFQTHHVMIPWGDDFTFREADKQFTNMDSVMKEINDREPGVRVKYSTATEYFDAVHRAASAVSLRFPLFTGDFVPYADAADGYWTGYFSSRPVLKRAVRGLEVTSTWANTLFSLARAWTAAAPYVPRVSAISPEGLVLADVDSPPTSWGVGLARSLTYARKQLALLQQASTGVTRMHVYKDYYKRCRTASEALMHVAMESLSHLLAKRRAAFTAPGAHVRPVLNRDALFALCSSSSDGASGAGGSSSSLEGRQVPVMVFNEGSVVMREVVSLRVTCPWVMVRRVRVLDAKGVAVSAQVHKALVSDKTSTRKTDVPWTTEIVLSFYVEVPALGFATYFVSMPTTTERVADAVGGLGAKSANAMGAAATQLQVFDIEDGVIAPAGAGAQQTEGVDHLGVRVMTTLPATAAVVGGSSSNSNSAAGGACLILDNERLAVEMECHSGLLRAVFDKRLRKRVLLRQQVRVYEGPNKSGASSGSGAGLFRPRRAESTPVPLGDRGRITIGLVRGPLVQQVHVLADGFLQVVSLIRAPPGLDANAVTWLEAHVHVSHQVVGAAVNTDTVVRYSTDVKSRGSFFTDNPAGTLTQRQAVADAPLPSVFFPCASTLALRPHALTSADNIVTTFVNSQVTSCTGAAAGVGSGGASDLLEYGAVEFVVNRNHATDDGRGLGEGVEDFGVSRMDTFLYLDSPEASFTRRADLVSRVQRLAVDSPHGGGLLFFGDPSSSLAPLLSRETWLSRFLGTGSFAKEPLGGGVRLVGLQPRDDFSDDVVVRLQAVLVDSVAKVDLNEFFVSDLIVVTGVRAVGGGEERLVFPAAVVAGSGGAGGASGGGGGGSGGGGASLPSGNDVLRLSEYASGVLLAAENGVKSSSTGLGGGGAGVLGGAMMGKTGTTMHAGLKGNRPARESGVFVEGNKRPPLRWPSLVLELRQGDVKILVVGLEAVVSASSASSSSSSSVASDAASPARDRFSRLVDGSLVTTTGRTTTTAAPSRVVATPSGLLPEDESVAVIAREQERVRGKSATDLRASLLSEEQRLRALEARVMRLKKNTDELVAELEILSALPDSPERTRALDELARAEEQLVEADKQHATSRLKVQALQRELDHSEALEELRSRSQQHGSSTSSMMGGGGMSKRHHAGEDDRETVATVTGMLAGAAAMLVFVILVQWLSGRTKRSRNQAFVPVRYGLHMHPSMQSPQASPTFFSVNKRL